MEEASKRGFHPGSLDKAISFARGAKRRGLRGKPGGLTPEDEDRLF